MKNDCKVEGKNSLCVRFKVFYFISILSFFMSLNNKIIACNWKLNMDKKTIDSFFNDILISSVNLQNLIIFPPFVYLDYCVAKSRAELDKIQFGAQDVSQFVGGAYTGDVAASMIADCNAKFCLVGHSERRVIFNDTNEIIEKKLTNALEISLQPILCIGESKNELENGKFETVISSQLSIIKNILAKKPELLKLSNPQSSENIKIIIAYEPVWAIGTGMVPSIDQINQKHSFIKNVLSDIDCTIFAQSKVVYGGSVNESNFKNILQIQNVDGLLIGGASLKSQNVISFLS